MNGSPGRWTGLGLVAALLGCTGLAACGGEGGGAPVPAAPVEADGGGQAVKPLDPALLLPVDERAVLMAGRVTAAAALARAGHAGDAARHLRLAIGEIRPGGLTRLVENGLDPDLFEAAAEALEAGAPPAEAEASLAAVEENIRRLRDTAGGDRAELIAYLMKRCFNAYREGVSLDNTIVDPIPFEEAYGLAVEARRLADGLEADEVRLELELLVRMWPGEGPLPDVPPAPLMTLAAQVNRVELALSALQ